MQINNKKLYVISFCSLLLVGCASTGPTPPQNLNSAEFDTPPSLQLTQADGSQYIADFKIHSWIHETKNLKYLAPMELKHAHPYLYGVNYNFVNVDYVLVPFEQVTSIKRHFSQFRVNYKNGTVKTWYRVYVAACPSGMANPKPSDCLLPAPNTTFKTILTPLDGSAVQQRFDSRAWVWNAGVWSNFPAGKRETLLASLHSATERRVQQQKHQARLEAEQKQRALRVEKARYNAVLRRMDAHGRIPSARLISYLQKVSYPFYTSSQNPCFVSTNPLTWQDGPWLNLAHLDMAGVGHIIMSRDRVKEYYSDNSAVQMKYTVYAGNGVNLSFSSLDTAHRGVSILRDLAKRCRAIGQ